MIALSKAERDYKKAQKTLIETRRKAWDEAVNDWLKNTKEGRRKSAFMKDLQEVLAKHKSKRTIYVKPNEDVLFDFWHNDQPFSFMVSKAGVSAFK